MGHLGGIGRIFVTFSHRGGCKPRRLGKIGTAASRSRRARRKPTRAREVVGNSPRGCGSFSSRPRSFDGGLHGGGAADTARTLRLIEFVKRYGEHEEDRIQLEQWRADATRIHAAARAMLLLRRGQYEEALKIAWETISEVDALLCHL